MRDLALFVAGVVVAALPAFWWARVHRAHRDYQGAKAAVPKARAALLAAGKAFLKVSVIALAAIAVVAYAATHG